MPALLLLALKFLGTTAIFIAAEKIFESIIDKDEETALDEILGGVTATAFFGTANLLKIKKGIQNIPLAKNVTSPKAAADFLEAIVNNQKGAAAINAKLGGFGPLVIKLAKGAAAILTKKGILLTVGSVLIYKFVSWLIWAPQLGQQFLDQGVFAPEQANTILASWGIPEKWRWPISEVRETQTKLEEIKLDTQLARLATNIAGIGTQPITIIRMTDTKEREQFIGTLFSAKLGDMKSFDRHIDDEITDEADLLEDVKLNLMKWLASLPGRLGYSVVIRNDPVDSAGVKQSGTWATLTTHFTRLSGPIQPIDTILLGPIAHTARLKLSKTTKTVETRIPELLTGQEVREISIPSGAVDIFNLEGERITLSGVLPSPDIPIPEPTTTEPSVFTPAPTDETTPTPTPEPTPEPTPTPEPVPAPIVPEDTEIRAGDVAFVTGVAPVNLNIRSTPSTSATILATIPEGEEVMVRSIFGEADGFTWANIQVKRTQRLGFVAVEFLRKS